MLMSNRMNHYTGRDDKDDCSHDGHRSGPIGGDHNVTVPRDT